MAGSEEVFWVTQCVFFGRREAFDCLVRKYQSSIRRFFLHQTYGDAAMSDDLAQETFIKAWLNIGSFKAMSKFSTWLYRIAYNVWYDHRYRKSAHPSCGLDQAEQCQDIGNTLVDEAMDLHEACKRLREEERTAVLLAFMEGLSHSQVAEAMGCPLGTAKSHIARGKEKLYVYLQKSAYDVKGS